MKKPVFCFVMTFLAIVSASAKEPMKRLTDRVFEVARQHCVNMDETLTETTFPRSIKNGKFCTSDASWWCSGFYPGTLWYVHMYTGDEQTKVLAEKHTEKRKTKSCWAKKRCSCPTVTGLTAN